MLAALALSACTEEAPVRAELQVVIDTDVPVPSQIGDSTAAPSTVRIDRLRIDVFDATGETWLDSRDIYAGAASIWPVSFGVTSKPDDAARSFRLRLRAYPSNRLRSVYELDENGEPLRDSTGAMIPKLDLSGQPLREPRAVFTVDRVVHTSLHPGRRRQVSILLLGDCMSVPADVVAGTSCVYSLDEPTAVVVGEERQQDVGKPGPSQVGSWPRAHGQDCAGTARAPTPGLFDEEICVRGGVFHLGDDRVVGQNCDRTKDSCDAVPERFVALTPSYMDRFSVTIGRLRAALSDPQGPFVLKPLDLLIKGSSQEGIGPPFTDRCTWTAEPSDGEDLPVNCIRHSAARRFCQWAGGDLPTEAQWEFAATAARRPQKAMFPWGDQAARCDGAVFGRGDEADSNTECLSEGFAPGLAPVTEGLVSSLPDETPPPSVGQKGVVGMGGLVAEMTRDASPQPYDALCWQEQPWIDPSCEMEAAERYVVRGGTYAQARTVMKSARRGSIKRDFFSFEIGFRCVRPAGDTQ